LSGAIDLCPEYTGNAAFFFHQDGDPVWKDAAAGYARAAKLDYEKNRLVWLAPAPADNSWVIAVPASLAREHNLRTMEDFASFVRDGHRVRLAASAEFVESAAGLPAFEASYGFRLNARQLLVLSGGETAATMKAAADGISGVNAAMAYATDGALKALDLYALEDTRHAEPVYAPAPVIREASLASHPEISDILKPVFAKLDLASLRDLNEKVAVEGADPGAVAREFFRAQGLLR
jgi:osmoprotectant transport system substrate-binding protein